MITEFQNENRWLSNFYPCVVTYENRSFQSVENAYQSTKSNDEEWKTYCSNCSAVQSGLIKRKSREVELVPNWETFKIEVMMQLIFQKFTQEPFKTKLLETGEELIFEGNIWGDDFWGVSFKTMQGRNVLGIIIMDCRDYLQVQLDTNCPVKYVRYPMVDRFPMLQYDNDFNVQTFL